MMKTKWLLMMLAAAMFAVGNVALGDIVTRSIQSDLDDAEEFLNTAAHHGWTSPEYAQGNGWLDSSDLEVGDDDPLFWQVCAVQYDQLGIPTGSLITSAKLTFTVDEAGSAGESNDFTILGEAAGNASVFTDTGGGWIIPFDITSRARSTVSVSWNPPISAAVGETVDTPDISALIQDVVNQGGWSDNNRLTLMIYPDVYLALPDPTTGGPTDLATTVYEAGPGSDSATLTVEFNSEKKFFATNPNPANTTVQTTSNLELSWTNADPNYVGQSVYVDVWFGTDPNHPSANWTKVVTAGENTTSVPAMDASADGTYYWRVNTYRYGSPTGDPCDSLGTVWRFKAVSDSPPTVDAGVDMITWSGQAVSLAATVTDDGQSALTYLWTADAPAGVTVEFDPSTAVEDPTVTITNTKVPVFVSTVVNAGFEVPHPGITSEGSYVWYPYDTTIPIPGWSLYGGSGTDIALWWVSTDPNVGSYGYGGSVPEGNIIGVGYNGSEAAPEAGFAQVLVETVAANTTYTLTVEVGNNNWYAAGEYRVQLLAGGIPEASQSTITEGTVLAQEEGDSLNIPLDTFETVTVTHTTGANAIADPNVGKHLQIRLLVLDNASSVDVGFDDVKLFIDGEPAGEYVYPEPVTVSLTLAVNDEGNPTPVTDTMTIDVYDDACTAARIGLGRAADNPADFDENCITNLKDLAALLAKWLVDNSLTAPVVLTTATNGTDAYLKVDFNSNQDGGGNSNTDPDPSLSVANHNQAGWSSYHANHEVAAEFTTANYGGITVTPAWPNTTANTVQQSLDRSAGNDGNWDNTAGDIDLVTDFIGIDTRTGQGGNGNWDGTTGTPTYMTLTIGGLAAGEYNWTSFHHDTENCHGTFAVWLSTDGGANYTQLADGLMTDSTPGGNPASAVTEDGPDAYSLPSTYNMLFTANGTDDVVLRFAPYSGVLGNAVNNQLWGMNGFVIFDPNAPDVDAGNDWITLSGHDVTLAPTIVEKVPTDWINLTYLWSASPDTGVVFDPPAANVLAPTVTITKATDNPSAVTLTLAVYGQGKPNPVKDTMKIDVYEDTCLAAKAAGTVRDQTDIDESCITDLRDYAALASKWLVDYVLTVPVSKIPAVSTDKATYSVDETIVFSYSFAEGNATDWIGIFEAGASNDDDLYYYYLNGEIHGSIVENDPQLPVGSYEARLFFNDSYKLEAATSFDVQ